MKSNERNTLTEHYESFDESSRLHVGRGALEFLRTKELIAPELPPPGSMVLDIGGGDGPYVDWLSELGISATLVDIVPKHVSAARERGIDAIVGDARSLPFGDKIVDGALLLGPLYHLGDRRDRMAALSEAYRVMKPGAFIAAAAVSRTAVASDWYSFSCDQPDSRESVMVDSLINSGRDTTGFGAGVFYFHTAAEFAEEVKSAGFSDVRLLGVEGPGWLMIDREAPATDPIISKLARLASLADSDSASVATSPHMLILARHP